ncbi:MULTISPECIES: peptide methionine sulfoxide reductase [unclassified Nocardioides]|uniref:peptide methionine sulfoxide reductase n=1 Tax=unclassified Nocardioides TaxID=2615069 RepID=UPI000AB709D8|nr:MULTISPECIES: peptide methionine sulfoxide reductase [unclassified Nocardioides]
MPDPAPRPEPEVDQEATEAARLFARVPLGHSTVRYAGRTWSLTRSEQVGGRSQKVWAEERGGTAVVSANLYSPGDGADRFRPCEMPAAVVLDFLAGWEPT